LKKINTRRRQNGFRTEFIKAWKVAGAFVRTNGITKNSNRP